MQFYTKKDAFQKKSVFSEKSWQALSFCKVKNVYSYLVNSLSFRRLPRPTPSSALSSPTFSGNKKCFLSGNLMPLRFFGL